MNDFKDLNRVGKESREDVEDEKEDCTDWPHSSGTYIPGPKYNIKNTAQESRDNIYS